MTMSAISAAAVPRALLATTEEEGWAPARCRYSRTNHYFRGRLSLCGRFNTGPISPTVQRGVGGNDCQHCARLLKKESEK